MIVVSENYYIKYAIILIREVYFRQLKMKKNLLNIEETILSLSIEEKQELFNWMSQQLADSSSEKTEKSPAEILKQIAQLPLENQDTTFSGQDHDHLLYSENEGE